MKHHHLYKYFRISIVLIFLISGLLIRSTAQDNTLAWKNTDGAITAGKTAPLKGQVVKITGVRFAYPLVQHWIDVYNQTYPAEQVIIESRSSNDPASYDILIEAYELSQVIQQDREFLYLGRYAVLPIANQRSAFAGKYGVEGLNAGQIKQIFFHDNFVDRRDENKIKVTYSVYTRLQKAGVPITFATYFGYQQKDIQGKTIAGSDEHLVKALLRDSNGISYAPLPLAFRPETGTVEKGITIIPVDLDGNGKLNRSEYFYTDLSSVLQRLESLSAAQIHNIPLAYLHFSFNKATASKSAVRFLKWVSEYGETDLHRYGFLKIEPGKKLNEEFEKFLESSL